MWLLSGQPMVLMVWRVELLPRRWVPGLLPAGEPLPRPGSSRSSWLENINANDAAPKCCVIFVARM
jgi:hypothetical protein